MKLKLIVASMSMLGFVSCQVLAATNTTTTTTTDTTTTTTAPAPKHHRHHHKKVHHVKKVEAEIVYKDMPVMAEPVCTISHSSMLMIGMTQNMGRAIPSSCNPGWFERIMLSGGINVDMGKWGNRNGNFIGENTQRLSLNDAYFNVGAKINDWTKAFASISYNTATINDPTAATPANHIAEYSAAYSNNAQSGSTQTLQLEQAFITLANFDESPIFVQVGKQFQDFSRYPLHPITRSLTQVMSETLATSAKIGFVAPMGFTGSAFVFDNPIPQIGQSSKPTNYGASLGIDMPSDQFGWDLGVAYLWDLMGVNDIAYAVNQFNIAAGLGEGYQSRTSGVAAYGDINFGPFVFDARYTTATGSFNVQDLPSRGVADISPMTGLPIAGATGAKPWTAGVQAGYGFDAFWGRQQDIFLGYQWSGEAAGLLLPKHRWLAGYNIDMWKDTKIGIEWDHDNAYGTGSGGNGKTTNLVSLRAGVQFS